MNISKIAIVSVPVRDQEVAKSFYVDVLGFDVVRDNPMSPDARWIQLTPPGAATAITLVTWFESMPAGCLCGLVLETDDIQAACAALQARGVDTSDIATAPWGQYLTFCDPDDNGWILQQPAS